MSLGPNHLFTHRSINLVMAKKKKFGRYEILGEIGQGAMGKVYKARDPLVDRVVAVKAIKADVNRPTSWFSRTAARRSWTSASLIWGLR